MKTVIEMAREAGFNPVNYMGSNLELFERFAELVRADERAQQQEPVAWVLLRQDEDGFEPIRFYGGKQKPEGDFKDRFTLRPVCFADATPPAQRKPLTDWVNVDERLPEKGGYYLVTVDTDDGPHVDVLLFNEKRKHWEHEGEPTFCHSYFFNPTHWANRPEAAHNIKKNT